MTEQLFLSQDDLISSGLFIPATAADYMQWLEGYLECGGCPTDHYDCAMPDNWYTAYCDFEITSLWDSKPINIIVADGARAFGRSGPHKLFYMSHFTVQPRIDIFVPVYTDSEFMRIPDIIAQRAKRNFWLW